MWSFNQDNPGNSRIPVPSNYNSGQIWSYSRILGISQLIRVFLFWFMSSIAAFIKQDFTSMNLNIPHDDWM